MASRLNERIAVVTGGASGIGKATCEKFASEGANVVLVDLNADGLNEVHETITNKYGDKHLQTCGDVSDSNFIKQVFEKISKKYGRPATVLVNCAGILLPPGSFLESSEEKLDKILNVNLKSVFLTSRMFVNELKTEDEMKKASIVQIASIAAKVGEENFAEYAASKAGIVGATKSMGRELGPKGIRCNAVLPGGILTPMVLAAQAEMNAPPNATEMFEQMIPLRRIGQPEEVANVCLFLASEESSYVTCGSYEVTGGWNA